MWHLLVVKYLMDIEQVSCKFAQDVINNYCFSFEMLKCLTEAHHFDPIRVSLNFCFVVLDLALSSISLVCDPGGLQAVLGRLKYLTENRGDITPFQLHLMLLRFSWPLACCSILDSCDPMHDVSKPNSCSCCCIQGKFCEGIEV